MKHNVNEKLVDFLTPMSELHLDPANVNEGHDIPGIAAALEEFTQLTLLVVNEQGLIEKGNGTYQAAQSLGWTHIGALWVGHDPVTGARYSISDNRLGKKSRFNMESLKRIVGSLDEPETIPGADEDWLGLVRASGEEEPPVEDVAPRIDKAAELQEVWQTELGQIWQLGEHRLVCGDCTDSGVVEAVMDGKKAEMMFTDPPYGVGYTGGHFHSGDVNIKRERPKLAGDNNANIYAKFLPIVLPFVDGPCYVWFASSVGKPVFDAIIDNGCQIHAMIIWHKVNATYAAMNAQYKQRHEPCMYFKPKGSTLRWVGPTNECTVWDEKRDGVNEYHPTQKPIVLPERAIKNHKAQTVLDVFAGSGSTIIACERLNRKCRAIEIEPKYVAVTLQRYLDATGKAPELIGNV